MSDFFLDVLLGTALGASMVLLIAVYMRTHHPYQSSLEPITEKLRGYLEEAKKQ